MGLFDAAFLAFGAVMILIMALQIAIVFWIWMLIECVTREPRIKGKILWTAMILSTLLIGAGFYYLERRPRRKAEVGA